MAYSKELSPEDGQTIQISTLGERIMLCPLISKNVPSTYQLNGISRSFSVLNHPGLIAKISTFSDGVVDIPSVENERLFLERFSNSEARAFARQHNLLSPAYVPELTHNWNGNSTVRVRNNNSASYLIFDSQNQTEGLTINGFSTRYTGRSIEGIDQNRLSVWEDLTQVSSLFAFFEHKNIMYGDLQIAHILKDPISGSISLVDYGTAMLNQPTTGYYEPFYGKLPEYAGVTGYCEYTASPEQLFSISSDNRPSSFTLTLDRYKKMGIPDVDSYQNIYANINPQVSSRSDVFSFRVIMEGISEKHGIKLEAIDRGHIFADMWHALPQNRPTMLRVSQEMKHILPTR